EFVKSDWSWNLDLLNVWLPEDVICRIISILPPHSDSGSDRQRLLTNSERVRRGTGHSNSYTLCRHAVEDLAHVLRDCPFAKDLWTFNTSWTATDVVKTSSCWARQYELCIGSGKRNNPSSNSANISDDTWVFLSTDGAVAKYSGYVATGGIQASHYLD
ncbi:hypothetical protein Gorai_019210, partial [Gossypium raimondii]|nr:hypothetical protein [Gossypium raimondii]